MAVVIKTLIVTFSDINDVEIDDELSIFITNGSINFSLKEIFKNIRTRSGQVSTATSGNLADVNAFNFSQSINLDGILYSLESTVNENVVTLNLTTPFYYFTSATGNLVDDGKVTITTSTQDPIIEKTVAINSYISKAPNYCADVYAVLDVTGGSEVYNVYVNNVLTVSNETTPISVSLLRGNVDSLRIVDDEGVTIGTVTSTNPRKVISSDITNTILNLSAGATLTINVNYISPYVSPYEYSLDGITYQSSNVYTSLIPNNYTIYVKDALGCVTEKNIVIDGVTEVTETIFTISDINPFRFAKIESGKKNYKNTLSCNELRLVKYPYYQQFIESDVITTQFKTNASYINAFTIDKDLNTNTLSVVKRTENIGLKAKSTCTFFDLGDGRSGVYFGVVDLLNPLNNDVIGDADFGFSLPEWANKDGNYVTIEDIGEVKIDAIGYSETYQSFILEFDMIFSGNSDRNISANYNLQPYEIYEFKTTMSDEPLQFNVVIEVGSDSDNIDFTYVSETIKRVDDSDFLFEIDYYMEDNKNIGDMVYQTGIKNKLRLNGHVKSLGEQTTEGYDGNKEYYVTDNSVYNSEKFSFFRLSTAMADKLRLVVAHSYLSINGVRYKLSEPPEVPESEFSNLKNFFVTLKSGGDLFLESSQEQIQGTSSDLELASAITSIQGKGALLWTKL